MPCEQSSLSRTGDAKPSHAGLSLRAMLFAVAAASPFGAISAHAQSPVAQRIVAPPPAAQALRGRTDSNLFSLSLGPLLSAPLGGVGEAVFDLNVEYTESKIYNP